MSFYVLIILLLWDVGCSEWSAKIPSNIQAVSGLCVHIPCSYSYPGGKAPASRLKGIWYKGKEDIQIYNSKQTEKANAMYVSRTRLLGDLEKNDCSLKISQLGSADAAEYLFRIEIESFNSYSYKANTATVQVLNTPPAPSMHCPGVQRDGATVSLVCMIVHYCPEEAPVLQLTTSQGMQVDKQPQSQQQVERGWEERIVFNLKVSAKMHGDVVRCSAVFPNGLQEQGPDCRLTVTYSPKNVTVNLVSPVGRVTEGDTVVLSCQSNSHPTPNSYSWYHSADDRDQLLPDKKEQELSLDKISRNPGRYWCQAQNSMGTAKSQPLSLDVLYPPEITEESWCALEEAGLNCVCVAYGNPPPSVQLSFLHLQDLPVEGEVKSYQPSHHKAVVSLNAQPAWNDTAVVLHILCRAENSLSSTFDTFTVRRNNTSEVSSQSLGGLSWGVWGSVIGLGLTTVLLLILYLLFSRRSPSHARMDLIMNSS